MSNIQVGDIVLIGDDVKNRLLWLLARVIELFPGKDGIVRTVKLKTPSGTFIRPIQSVFHLEVSVNELAKLPLYEKKVTKLHVLSPQTDRFCKYNLALNGQT